MLPLLTAGAATPFGAMIPIASVTFTNSTTQGAIFANIPQTYQDLEVVVYGRSQRAAATSEVYCYLNNDGGLNYSRTRIHGDGAGAFSNRNTNSGIVIFGEIPAASAASGIFGSCVMHIVNYRSSTYKTTLSRSACDMNGSGYTHLYANLWRGTGAITNIDIYNTNAEPFTAGTVVALYGIRSVGQ